MNTAYIPPARRSRWIHDVSGRTASCQWSAAAQAIAAAPGGTYRQPRHDVSVRIADRLMTWAIAMAAKGVASSPPAPMAVPSATNSDAAAATAADAVMRRRPPAAIQATANAETPAAARI